VEPPTGTAATRGFGLRSRKGKAGEENSSEKVAVPAVDVVPPQGILPVNIDMHQHSLGARSRMHKSNRSPLNIAGATAALALYARPVHMAGGPCCNSTRTMCTSMSVSSYSTPWLSVD
jgi:hypothetical protein